MRVWAFPSMYPYDRPGMTWAGIFAHRQYKGLIENGAELQVIIPVPWHPPFPLSALHPDWKKQAAMAYPLQRGYDGITVHHPRIANMRPNRLVKKTFQQRYVSAIVAFFRDHKIQLDPTKDIFYSQWLPDAAMVQQAAHLLGVKSAVIGIGDDVIVWPKSSDANFKTFEKLYTEADLRIFNADYLGREANEQLGKAMPYETVYFGVDHSAFRPATAGRAAELKKEYHIPAGKVAILIVGTALKRKGWIDLFDALAAVKKVNSGFILVGGHAGSQDLVPADEAAKRGLTAEFLDLGEIRPQDLGKLYNAADIFCLPSHWEGLPTVVIEAMSSGLPVITTNVCGQPEVVSNNGVNGILVTPKDIPALTEALLTLIADAGKRAYLGHNAREFIVNEWGNYTQNAAKLYRKFEALLSR